MDAELPDEVRQVCATFLHAMNSSAEGLVDGLYLRGSLTWGEFFDSSDIDFTCVLSRRPAADDLLALEAAHTQIWFEHPQRNFDGHHVLLDDLRAPASQCPPVPVSHAGAFTESGDLDVNPVSWAELATRGIRLQGRDPQVLDIHHHPDELRAFTVDNLATYWARWARDLVLGWPVAGRRDDLVAWCTLGVARLHHLLATGQMTSKSGAGRYVLASLDERWHPLATEALRIREHPDEERTMRSAQRGKLLRDFVAWCVADGQETTRG